MTQPVVSILCTVYNKAPWLEQTLASFVAQETNFPVEILIVDDASTDSSWDIIQAFQAKYPDNVLIFSNPVNQGIAKTWVELCAMPAASTLPVAMEMTFGWILTSSKNKLTC